jgi:hypothetical protein
MSNTFRLILNLANKEPSKGGGAEDHSMYLKNIKKMKLSHYSE